MTMTTTPTRSIPLHDVGRFVDGQTASLQKRAVRNESTAVAALARLRRGVDRRPGELVDLLPYTHHDEFTPARDDDEPTYREIAVHTALTLFALHQQSQPRAMHVPGRGLGAAMRATAPGAELPEALLRRFRVLGTSEGLNELTHHLRGVIQLLRQAAAPVDYGRLADQLVTWQFVDGPASVRLQWGREFYRTPSSADGRDPTDGVGPTDTISPTETGGTDQ